GVHVQRVKQRRALFRAEDRKVILVLEFEQAGGAVPDRLERMDVRAHVHEADVQQDEEGQEEEHEQPDIGHTEDEAPAWNGKGRSHRVAPGNGQSRSTTASVSSHQKNTSSSQVMSSMSWREPLGSVILTRVPCGVMTMKVL